MSGDPFFGNVSLLLHCDGTNGSTTFTDKSPNVKTATPVGDARISTAISKFGGASALFDGVGDWLTLDGSTDFAFGMGDFTIEYWFYNSGGGSGKYWIDFSPDVTNGIYPVILSRGFDGNITFSVNGVERIIAASAVAGNTWHHVAVSRVSGVTRLFINGSQAGSNYTDTNNYLIGAVRPIIGARGSLASDTLITGHIDDLRITKGVGRYTANFIPPAAAFPDANYVLQGSITATGLPEALLYKIVPRSITGSILVSGNVSGNPHKAVAFSLLGAIAETTDVTSFLYLSLAADAMAVTGGSFASSLEASISSFEAMTVTGGAFASSLDSFFGTNVSGGAFKSVLDATITGIPSFFISGGAFNSSLSATISYETHVKVTGGAFASRLESVFGWNVEGGGFASALTAELTGWASMSVSGGAFSSSLQSFMSGYYGINVTGGAFKSQLLWMDVAGGGFATELNAHIETGAANSVAFVMNVVTTECSQWTNMPFNHIITIGQKFYGVTATGLYELKASIDTDTLPVAGTVINAVALTKDSDLGSFQSKNCPAIYLDSDTLTQITPIVDSVRKSTYPSSFNGRRTKLGLGNSGRFWQFEIQAIKKLSAYELLVKERQRRVK